MRRTARLLKTHRNTVARKLKFLADQARLEHIKYLESLKDRPIDDFQFDDLESMEHSKCKPLSVTLAVVNGTRKILGHEVSRMPAKGHLAEIAKIKYGFRPDERSIGINSLFEAIKDSISPNAKILSDKNPLYLPQVEAHFPNASYRQVKSRRACVAGQGELKKGGHDPLFSLNHTCAMLRANINRLFRRTWCTTKKIQGLRDHMAIYIKYHNQVLTSSC